MAGVEDIPQVVMTEGLRWDWESFPDYLDAVAARSHDVDIAAMLPHSALRVYVMGDRAVAREAATPEDIAQMAELTRSAMAAGALGFGTSRALQQRSASGVPIPTVRAAEDELRGILMAMADSGSGVFQLLSDFDQFNDIDGEFAMLRRLAAESGRPLSFTLNQKHSAPDQGRQLLALTEQANNDGLAIKAQVLGRPTGLLLGHDLTLNPFAASPTYASLMSLAFDERIAELRNPDIRHRVLADVADAPVGPWQFRYELSDPPDYEPDPNDSIAARAERAGTTPESVAYDIMLGDGGHRLISHPFQNYAAGSLDACHEMLQHRDTILGLGDGGAHCGLICDASYPTTMLAYWTRDRVRGPRLDLADVVKALTADTADTADAVGLHDRGRIAVGFKADLNVIDYDHLTMHAPEIIRDLPAGGRRLKQRAEGYTATIVNGTITYQSGQATGGLPGRLIRGAQSAPAA